MDDRGQIEIKTLLEQLRFDVRESKREQQEQMQKISIDNAKEWGAVHQTLKNVNARVEDLERIMPKVQKTAEESHTLATSVLSSHGMLEKQVKQGTDRIEQMLHAQNLAAEQSKIDAEDRERRLKEEMTRASMRIREDESKKKTLNETLKILVPAIVSVVIAILGMYGVSKSMHDQTQQSIQMTNQRLSEVSRSISSLMNENAPMPATTSNASTAPAPAAPATAPPPPSPANAVDK